VIGDIKPIGITYKSCYSEIGKDKKEYKYRVSNKFTQELLQIIFNFLIVDKLNKICIYKPAVNTEILLSSTKNIKKNKTELSETISTNYQSPDFSFIKCYDDGHAYLRFEKYINGHYHLDEVYNIDDLPGQSERVRENQVPYVTSGKSNYYEKNGFKILNRLSKDFWIILEPDHDYKSSEDINRETLIMRFSNDDFVSKNTDVLVKLNGGDVNKYVMMLIGLILVIVIIVCIVVVIIKYTNKNDLKSTKS
jgi:hypothetical protein